MHHLIIRRTINSIGKNDATGAFIPESAALKKLLEASGDSVDVVSLNECRPDSILTKYTRQDTVSVFCHGWARRIEALPRRKAGAFEVAQWMQNSGCEFLNLFACSAADEYHKRGCFARWVAEHCHKLRHLAQVFGHETAGHTSWNPKARYYWSTPQGVSTERLYDPELDSWEERKNFRERMRNDQEYRLLLPFIFED